MALVVAQQIGNRIIHRSAQLPLEPIKEIAKVAQQVEEEMYRGHLWVGFAYEVPTAVEQLGSSVSLRLAGDKRPLPLGIATLAVAEFERIKSTENPNVRYEVRGLVVPGQNANRRISPHGTHAFLYLSAGTPALGGDYSDLRNPSLQNLNALGRAIIDAGGDAVPAWARVGGKGESSRSIFETGGTSDQKSLQSVVNYRRSEREYNARVAAKKKKD